MKRFKLSQMQKVVEDHDSDETADKNIYVHLTRFLMMKCCVLLEFNGKCLTRAHCSRIPAVLLTLQNSEKQKNANNKCCRLPTKEQILIQQVL